MYYKSLLIGNILTPFLRGILTSTWYSKWSILNVLSNYKFIIKTGRKKKYEHSQMKWFLPVSNANFLQLTTAIYEDSSSSRGDAEPAPHYHQPKRFIINYSIYLWETYTTLHTRLSECRPWSLGFYLPTNRRTDIIVSIILALLVGFGTTVTATIYSCIFLLEELNTKVICYPT